MYAAHPHSKVSNTLFGDSEYHLYADGTQLFLSCRCLNRPLSRQQSLCKLGACITDIRQCMPRNGLKQKTSNPLFTLHQYQKWHCITFHAGNEAWTYIQSKHVSSSRNNFHPPAVILSPPQNQQNLPIPDPSNYKTLFTLLSLVD